MSEEKDVIEVISDKDEVDIFVPGFDLVIRYNHRERHAKIINYTPIAIAKINQISRDEDWDWSESKRFRDYMGNPVYVARGIKMDTGYILISIGYDSLIGNSYLSISFTPSEFRKILKYGLELVTNKNFGGSTMKDTDMTKDEFIKLKIRHARVMDHIIRALLQSPDYTITTYDVNRISGLDGQRIRNVLSELVKEGFLKRIGKRGLYTVYTATVDRETLVLWIKEFYGLD